MPRPKESAMTGRGPLDAVSLYTAGSRSPDSSGSSGDGVLPEAEVTFSGTSEIRASLDVTVGKPFDCLCDLVTCKQR
jgi:hypothetical protein